MYIYKAKNPETFQIINEKFSTLEEAQQFANANKDNYVDAKIESLFSGVDGLVIENDPDEDIDMDYDEEAELGRMGLNDPEIEEGFDWTFEDKSGGE